MKESLRSKFWYWFIAKTGHKLGARYPFILRILVHLIFPFKTFFWEYICQNGYQPLEDVWIIHGMEYADAIFRNYAFNEKGTFEFTKHNNIISLKKLENKTYPDPDKIYVGPLMKNELIKLIEMYPDDYGMAIQLLKENGKSEWILHPTMFKYFIITIYEQS